jgi:hypothetical protein
MSRLPTGHGFWMPASIAGDAWPAVFGDKPMRRAYLRSSCSAPQTPMPSRSTQHDKTSLSHDETAGCDVGHRCRNAPDSWPQIASVRAKRRPSRRLRVGSICVGIAFSAKLISDLPPISRRHAHNQDSQTSPLSSHTECGLAL